MIANADGNFLNGEFSLPEEFRSFPQPLVREKMIQINAHFKFE